MTDILKCDICCADAGNDPYHITFMGNGHIHVCSNCFDPQQHDVGVLSEKLNAVAKDAEQYIECANNKNWLNSALRLNQKLLSQVQTLEMQRDELLEALRYWVPNKLPFSLEFDDVICNAHNEQWNKTQAILAKATSFYNIV